VSAQGCYNELYLGSYRTDTFTHRVDLSLRPY